MWLVLEGIDGAGKTTLAEKLAESHPDYQVIHVGPPGQGGSFQELAHDWATLELTHVIWDRGHLGELVYRDGLTVGQLRLLEALLLNHNGITCVLTTSPTLAAERIAKRDGVEDSNGEVGRLYKEAIKFQQVCGDLKSYWHAGNVRSITTLFEDWQQYDSIRHMDHEGVGTNTPDFWLLGEQRNPKAPVQVPFSTQSGLELVWSWVNPLTMRVSNVLEPLDNLSDARSGKWDEASLGRLYFRWVTLSKPRVITFGTTAFAACTKAGVKVSLNVEHPSHVWRFRSAEVLVWRNETAKKVERIA